MNQAHLDSWRKRSNQQQPAVLATVIEVSGASPAKVGAKLLLRADGTTAGTVGGGKLEEVDPGRMSQGPQPKVSRASRTTPWRKQAQKPSGRCAAATCASSSSHTTRRPSW